MISTSRFAVVAASILALAASAAEPVIIQEGDTIAFLGDSITGGGDKPTGFINLVLKGLELSGVHAGKIASGHMANRSTHMRDRLQRDVLDKHPQWMTLSCGVNDVWHGANGVPLEEYRANIANILDRCAAAGVKVIVLTATMIGEDPDNENNKKLAAYNDFLRQEAAARKLPLADLNSDMQALLKTYPPETRGYKLTADGVHMAWDGNRMMARGILLAMGVPKEKMPEIEKAWRQIRGYRDYTLSVSFDEAEAIEARVKAEGRPVVDILHAQLFGK